MASLTVTIFSASSSGISISNSSSRAITSSTMSKESAPKSSMMALSPSTSSNATPSCSAMMSLTFLSTDDADDDAGMGKLNPSGPDDLDVLQEAARRANPVRQTRRGATRTLLDLQFRQMLMSPAVIAAGLGFFSLGNRHNENVLLI